MSPPDHPAPPGPRLPRDGLPVLSEAPLVDRLARRIRYLRVSITDRCNYRCAYCMPAEGWALAPRADILSIEEIGAVVEVFAKLGVERVRLTGGEPLVRRGVVELVERLAALPGIRSIAMTTNGHLLARDAAALRAAGLTELNVSIDSLDPARFARLTRGGDLAAVLAGLDAAQEAGFTDIKLNAVSVAGENEDELAELCAFAWSRGFTPRFIELMPIGGLDFASEAHVLPEARVRALLAERYELVTPSVTGSERVRGPAHYLEVATGPFAGKRVGLISPMTDEGFCGSCNRARLTSRGGFRPCLGNDDEVSLRDALRSGATFADLSQIIADAVQGKLPAHRMTRAEGAPRAGMTQLGG